MKTVICGPPHSGKSVFIANLTKELPADIAIIRACPDGEGTWSNNQDQENVQEVRLKGKFSQEFIDISCEHIDSQPKEIVTIVDVGGIISKENRQVFEHCDSFIVLSSDPEKAKEWEAFGKSLGLTMLASIDSQLHGQEALYEAGDVIRGKVTELERGTYQESEVIKAIADGLIRYTERETGISQREYSDLEAQRNIRTTVITNDELGTELGIKQDDQIRWEAGDLPKINDLLKDVHDTNISLYGIKANFVMATIVRQMHDQGCSVQLYDMFQRDYQQVQPLSISDGIRGNPCYGIDVKQTQTAALITFSPKTNFIKKEDFDQIVLPKIPEDKEIFISGRMPHWALAEVVMAYPNTNIHVFQPGIGSICISGDPGKLIATKEMKEMFEEKNLIHEKETTAMQTIKLDELAKKIGNEPREVTLPNGQTRTSIVWDAETAQKAIAEIYPLSATGETVTLDGPAPAWFVSSLTHAVHPCPVGLFDPKVGVIQVPGLPKEHLSDEYKSQHTNEQGSLEFKSEQGEVKFKISEGEKFVKLEWNIDNGTVPPVYDHGNLPKITVPELPAGKEVVISGRGPNYVQVAIAEAYAHTSKAISFFQPQTQGYTVGITHAPERKVGDLIPAAEVEKDIESFKEKDQINMGDLDERVAAAEQAKDKGEDVEPNLDSHEDIVQ